MSKRWNQSGGQKASRGSFNSLTMCIYVFVGGELPGRHFLAPRYPADLDGFLGGAPEKVASIDMLVEDLDGEDD